MGLVSDIKEFNDLIKNAYFGLIGQVDVNVGA